MLRCIRCTKEFNPNENPFGGCFWHSGHALDKTNVATVQLLDEVKDTLPMLTSKTGSIDLNYVVNSIPLGDLLVQIDSNVVKSVKEKLLRLPPYTTSLIKEMTLGELIPNGWKRLRFEQTEPRYQEYNLILQNLLSDYPLASIVEQIKQAEIRNLPWTNLPTHPHLLQGISYEHSSGKSIWRCCGRQIGSQGCWTGVHSSTSLQPDVCTTQKFERKGLRSLLKPGQLSMASEHIHNSLSNEKIAELQLATKGRKPTLNDATVSVFLKAVMEMNMFNGYELTNSNTWTWSRRAQELPLDIVDNIRVVSKRLETIWSKGDKSFNFLAIVQTISLDLSEWRNTESTIKKPKPRKNANVRVEGRYSALPENTKLIPNKGSKVVPRNPPFANEVNTSEFLEILSDPTEIQNKSDFAKMQWNQIKIQKKEERREERRKNDLLLSYRGLPPLQLKSSSSSSSTSTMLSTSSDSSTQTQQVSSSSSATPSKKSSSKTTSKSSSTTSPKSSSTTSQVTILSSSKSSSSSPVVKKSTSKSKSSSSQSAPKSKSKSASSSSEESTESDEQKRKEEEAKLQEAARLKEAARLQAEELRRKEEERRLFEIELNAVKENYKSTNSILNQSKNTAGKTRAGLRFTEVLEERLLELRKIGNEIDRVTDVDMLEQINKRITKIKEDVNNAKDLYAKQSKPPPAATKKVPTRSGGGGGTLKTTKQPTTRKQN